VRPVARATLQARALRFLSTTNSTRSSCDGHAAAIDLSESNHEDFRETAGTPASSARAAGTGVNPVLHHFPDERRMHGAKPVG
jgi:hypothetical protein